MIDKPVPIQLVGLRAEAAWYEVRARLDPLLWTRTTDYFSMQVLAIDVFRLLVLNQEVTP